MPKKSRIKLDKTLPVSELLEVIEVARQAEQAQEAERATAQQERHRAWAEKKLLLALNELANGRSACDIDSWSIGELEALAQRAEELGYCAVLTTQPHRVSDETRADDEDEYDDGWVGRSSFVTISLPETKAQ